MACRSCGQTKKQGVMQMQGNTVPNQQEKYESGDWVLVQYKGPNQTHNIGSLTGVITKYDMTVYGRGRNGDFFLVHKDDLNHKDSKFIAVPANKVKTVEKILKLSSIEVKSKVIEPSKAKVEEAIAEIVEEEPTEQEKKVEEAVDEIQDIARQVVSEGKILKRSEALSPTEFAEVYGYTHRLQVVAKVRSGELLSYKDANDKMFVYHVED